RFASIRRPGELSDPVQRASIKCLADRPTVFGPCPPLSHTAGLVTDAFLPSPRGAIGFWCIAPLHLWRHDRGAAVWHRDGPISMRKTSSALRPALAMNQTPLA